MSWILHQAILCWEIAHIFAKKFKLQSQCILFVARMLKYLMQTVTLQAKCIKLCVDWKRRIQFTCEWHVCNMQVHRKLFAIASGDFVSKECVINDCKTENAGGLEIKWTRCIHFFFLLLWIRNFVLCQLSVMHLSVV